MFCRSSCMFVILGRHFSISVKNNFCSTIVWLHIADIIIITWLYLRTSSLSKILCKKETLHPQWFLNAGMQTCHLHQLWSFLWYFFSYVMGCRFFFFTFVLLISFCWSSFLFFFFLVGPSLSTISLYLCSSLSELYSLVVESSISHLWFFSMPHEVTFEDRCWYGCQLIWKIFHGIFSSLNRDDQSEKKYYGMNVNVSVVYLHVDR